MRDAVIINQIKNITQGDVRPSQAPDGLIVC